MEDVVMSVGCSDALAVQSTALDYIYHLHSAAANVAFAQQMAVSCFRVCYHCVVLAQCRTCDKQFTGSIWAPCRLWGCKNGPTPGQIS